MVILVDHNDNPVGAMAKMEAHEKGLLHRAFSVLLFNNQGELLMQRRAEGKYHSGGLWANTCCSHPRPGENTEAAALRRLEEELGISAPLRYVKSFTYKAELDKGLTEHELDHVFIGSTDTLPSPNPNEVAECRFAALPSIREDMRLNPERYAEWFKIIMGELDDNIMEGLR